MRAALETRSVSQPWEFLFVDAQLQINHPVFMVAETATTTTTTLAGIGASMGTISEKVCLSPLRQLRNRLRGAIY